MAARAASGARGGRVPAAPGRRRSVVTAVVATVAVAGVLAGAVLALGYDAQKVPHQEDAVWVTRDSGQYARVNTDLAELDTVRNADDPSGVTQSGSRSVVYTQGYRRIWPVDAAAPADLVDSAADAGGDTTPNGTRSMVSAGPWVGYLTDTGRVFVGRIDDSRAAAKPTQIDPLAAQSGKSKKKVSGYVASAMGIDDQGRVALYSAKEKAVRVYSAQENDFVGGAQRLDSAPAADARLELSTIGGSWVLSDPAKGRVWVEGSSKPVRAGTAVDARLETGTSSGRTAYLADGEGLVAVDLESRTAKRTAAASGTPAAPVAVDGTVYAAWLSSGSGRLWSSARSGGGTRSLTVEGDALGQVQAITPVIRSNGARAVLNETESGMLWTLPDGTPIPLDQWKIEEKQKTEGTVQVDDVAEEEPPVAEPDVFGVRAGGQTLLPVLLNDHDPNKKDVLSIVPGSVGGLSDAGFGEVSLVGNDQQLVVRVRASSGTATFTYQVSDGQQTSPPATVTLHVVPDDQNSAPVWCGVTGCVQPWPKPAIAPGGSVTVPVLTGWVDAEGDPFVLADARKDDPQAPVSVVATADGRVAIRHNDPNGSAGTIAITVTVADARGATATKTLNVQVTGTPALVVKPAAIVGGVGEKTTVAIADHVSGGSGSYSLVDAVASTAAKSDLTVVPNAAGGTIDITGAKAGDYLVTYSVQDAQTRAEDSAVLRVSIVDAAHGLSMAPLTAFVRDQEDTTVDVLSGVQSTTGRVLVVSGVRSDSPQLKADVVGNARVRVSGSTSSGAPGVVGTAWVTVTDGSGASVEGALTVFLVSPSTGVGPIAVPDAVTVRAGQQVDIPVTANDVSPRGERIVVHPDVSGSGTPGELVFAAGDTVRYLAPKTPGTYTLRYSVYLESDPSRLDGAAITVTVLPEGANRPPQPPILSGRVLSGQTVRIPVTTTGVDPDGDPVVLASVDQPASGSGTATIAADGTTIVYTAPGNGVQGGQVSFDYRLRDTQGAIGRGVVRVGVLPADIADLSPVTYTDYARVREGAKAPIEIRPLVNDRDPSQGTLQLVSLVPNTPQNPDNPEYQRLAALVDGSTDLKKGVVKLLAGDVLGAHSYIYTVRSSVTSSTSEGLIVVNVSEDKAPDHPVVADTVLGVADRDRLATGVDVVSGNVDWPSGDLSSLKLSLWGSGAGAYTVSGWSISGPLPKEGAIIPFAVTGTSVTGDKQTGYGFLRIPAFDDMRVQLRAGVTALKVGEEKSVTFDIDDLVQIGGGDRLEVRSQKEFAVQRANSTCVPGSGGSITYTAGREAPWTDSCSVPVRVAGQKAYTTVAVPIIVIPKAPQAILGSISRTIAPGDSQSVDLYKDMTTWEGGRVGDKSKLDYRAVASGSSFAVTQSGASVQIDTRADARPGTRETIAVTTTGFGGLQATITLIVGIAPADAPRGAVFTQQCTVSSGPGCTVQVIGHAGQYDPFEGKAGSGLKLVRVGDAGTVGCGIANAVGSGATAITATWTTNTKPPGGTCVVPYTVSDAQGRTGAGEVTFDILGYPATPASLVTTGYTGTTVTLGVTLGEAALAHPAVSRVTVYEAGQPVPGASCRAAGPTGYSCTVTGLENGQRHSFTARAGNSVGESDDTNPVDTSAYQAPAVQSVTATAVLDQRTSTSTARVDVKIVAGADVSEFVVQVGGNSYRIPYGGDTTEVTLDARPGQTTADVTPISQFRPPIGGGDGGGATVRSNVVNAAGAPYWDGRAFATKDHSTATLNGTSFNANGSTTPSVIYIASQSDTVQCVMQQDGTVGFTGGTATKVSTTPTISGLDNSTRYYLQGCGANAFGAAKSGVDSVIITDYTAPTTGTPQYTVRTTHTTSNNNTRFDWAAIDAPTVRQRYPGTWLVWNVDGGDRAGNFQTSWFSDSHVPTISVRECLNGSYDACGPTSQVTAATSPTIAWLQFPADNTCVRTAKPDDVEVSPAAGSNSVSITVQQTAQDPVDGKEVWTVVYTANWRGQYGPLGSSSYTMTSRCGPFEGR